MNSEDKTVTLTMIMEQHHANLFGNAHGGEIMRFMDNTAGCTAIKYSNEICVAARVDELQFLKPIHIGSLLTCTGEVVYTGTSSVVVRVTVDAEGFRDRNKYRATEAFFTCVAIDKAGKPTPVRTYEPETAQEKEWYEYVKQLRGSEFERRKAARRRAEEGEI